MTDRLTIPAHRTDVEMTQIVLPSHANNHGTVFGGQMAAWIDVCAAVSAQRFARKAVVTASMDEIHFVQPTSMVVILKARVNSPVRWRSACG